MIGVGIVGLRVEDPGRLSDLDLPRRVLAREDVVDPPRIAAVRVQAGPNVRSAPLVFGEVVPEALQLAVQRFRGSGVEVTRGQDGRRHLNGGGSLLQFGQLPAPNLCVIVPAVI